MMHSKFPKIANMTVKNFFSSKLLKPQNLMLVPSSLKGLKNVPGKSLCFSDFALFLFFFAYNFMFRTFLEAHSTNLEAS
jgi:hypothetical protein